MNSEAQILRIRSTAAGKNREEVKSLRLIANYRPGTYGETFDSALAAGEASLRALGYDADEVHDAAERFREHDLEVIRRMHAVRDHGVEVLASTSKELREELAELFAEDEQQLAPARAAARVAHAGSPGRNPG